MDLLALPQFVNYFKVSIEDERFFDDFIDRISVLAEQEFYVDNGLSFKHLLVELHRNGFLVGCELTDKEPHAVMSAQWILYVLVRIQVITRRDRETAQHLFRDVNDLDQVSGAVDAELYGRNGPK